MSPCTHIIIYTRARTLRARATFAVQMPRVGSQKHDLNYICNFTPRDRDRPHAFLDSRSFTYSCVDAIRNMLISVTRAHTLPLPITWPIDLRNAVLVILSQQQQQQSWTAKPQKANNSCTCRISPFNVSDRTSYASSIHIESIIDGSPQLL